MSLCVIPSFYFFIYPFIIPVFQPVICFADIVFIGWCSAISRILLSNFFTEQPNECHVLPNDNSANGPLCRAIWVWAVTLRSLALIHNNWFSDHSFFLDEGKDRFHLIYRETSDWFVLHWTCLSKMGSGLFDSSSFQNWPQNGISFQNWNFAI